MSEKQTARRTFKVREVWAERGLVPDDCRRVLQRADDLHLDLETHDNALSDLSMRRETRTSGQAGSDLDGGRLEADGVLDPEVLAHEPNAVQLRGITFLLHARLHHLGHRRERHRPRVPDLEPAQLSVSEPDIRLRTRVQCNR
eukprot:1651079-Rhodomonas_salina.1